MVYPVVYFELLFVSTLLVLGYNMLRPFLPIFASELDPTGLLVGLSVSSFFLARVFVELPSGLIVNKIGMRAPILLGLCLTTLGPFICASSNSIYILIFGLMLWGLGTAFVFTSTIALIIELFEPNVRGSALGKFHGIEFVGSFAGAPLGGFLAERLGYVVVFYITGVFIATTLLVAFASKDLKRVDSSPVHKPVRTSFINALNGLKNYGLLATCVAELSRMSIVQGIISALFPIYLYEFLKIDVGIVGIIIGVRALSFCMATLGIGHLSDRFGRKPVIFAGILIQSICIYLYFLASSLWLLLLLSFIEGIGTGMISVTLIALMSEQVKVEFTSGAVGLFRTFMDIGAVIGPILIMIILEIFGIYACFLFGTVLLLANIPILLPVRERKINHSFNL